MKEEFDIMEQIKEFRRAEEFFDNIEDSEFSKIRKLNVYNAYNRYIEAELELRKIEEIYKNPHLPQNRYTAWKISQDMYVVQLVSNRMSGYFSHVAGSSKCDILFDTFEQAIIGCLALKYTRSTKAVTWICKMLGI